MTCVAVLGSIAIDTICRARSTPMLGERVFGEFLGSYYGGMASNQAVALANVGAEAHLLGKVGTGRESTDYLSYLASRGVDTTLLARSSEDTVGRTFMFLTGDGEYFSVVAPGGNAKIDVVDIKRSMDVLENCSCLMAQLEIDVAIAEAAFALARERGMLTVLTISPPERVTRRVLDLSDIVIGNLREARMVLDVSDPLSEDLKSKLGISKRSYVFTLGKSGSAAWEKGTLTHEQSLKVAAVDTVGAGDAFAGAFVGTYLDTHDMGKALRRGNIAGALASAVKGAQNYTLTEQILSAKEKLLAAAGREEQAVQA
jgi:ribokinase